MNFNMKDIKTLVDSLFEEAKDLDKCPNIQRDKEGIPYCGKGLAENQLPNKARYLVCDSASLQFYCLDARFATKCIYYDVKMSDSH
jgi:hypothetical protein